jgi:ATP-dependent helicase/nuclease subunit A
MVVKDRKFTPHAVLKAEQRDASDPREHVWLSASAGTGKTYVLSARVLRLLLRGVKPDAILCLTFTKAGAAEMAERVHERLAHWVQIKSTELAAELRALDEDFGPEQVADARTLFAKVLESRGGGLRIMTIHAFCQTLLAGFPLEAGLSPGFRPLEGREQAVLVQSVLADLVITAEREGDARLLGDLRSLSLRLGEEEAVRFLTRAASAVGALEELGPGLGAIVRRAMDVPAEFSAADIAVACGDGAFDRAGLLDLADILNAWGSVRALDRLDVVSAWLHETPAGRARDLTKLARVWRKADGDLFASKGWIPIDPRYPSVVDPLDAWASELIELAARAELASDVTAALGAAQRYARAYADAKRGRGLVDFDDLIQLTRKLLNEAGMGDWIRYKLDQATDHILVDEAQDTNADQWAIVAALAGEFWAGEGAKGDKLRTLFTVGDFKQAIFGFQGTDPEIYRAVGKRFSGYAAEAEQEILRLSLDQSFRSTPPVLEVVDAVLDEVGGDALGLDEMAKPHVSAKGGAGEVVLFSAVTVDNDPEDEGEEGWIPSATRDLASKLANQVKAWLAEPMWLASRDRALTPGDVMILVRRRSDLAALLVARLHEEGVPVAGVDRLRLQAPLAVQDLLAAMRFAAQPQDDLNLANLLVSPMIGWSQDDLFVVAHGRAGVLWDAIPAGATRDALLAMLSAADNITPYAFLENLLSGALQGRKKLLERLGEEARDPVDELLNAALQFEREGTASLQQFLDWFDRGETEVVRDAGAAGDAVRVMTVHGAKGLQAPLVILADACADPDKALERNFKWTIEGVVDDLPLFRPRGAERALVASLQVSMDEADDKAKREHWRLLYVAMTRAEERLVIAGSLGPRARGVVPEESWHGAVRRALLRMGVQGVEDATWGAAWRHGQASAKPVRVERSRDTAHGEDGPSTAFGTNRVVLPEWLNRVASVEARPPRPLAPSSIGQDDVANPPPSAAMAAAAARGRLLHALFERLPALAAEDRRAAGARWLAAEGADEELVDVALRVIDDPRFAGIFAVDALAEAPVAGVVDGVVIAGTVDRLCVTDTLVEIVDFKTGRRVPASVDDIPVQHLRQMAAYVAVLEGIFPDREVRASLLYSEGPMLHCLSPELLAAHKPSFAAAQDNLVSAG